MKRILSFIICTLIAVICVVPCCAAVGEIEAVDAPYGVKYSVQDDGTNERIAVSCMFTDAFARLTSYPAAGVSHVFGYIQLDYRIDGGKWQYTAEWDTDPEACDYGAILDSGSTGRLVDLMYLVNQSAVDNAGALVRIEQDGSKSFDLENHSLEVRLRSGVGYVNVNGSFVTNSEWTKPVKIERSAPVQELPTKFDAPVISALELHYSEADEMPYFTFDVKTPESVKLAQSEYQAYRAKSLQLICYADYGSGWAEVNMSSSGGYLSDETKTVYMNESAFDDEKVFRFKLSYLIYGDNDVPLYSQESEILEVRVPRWEKGKGLLHAKCTTCGICKPVGGHCMFIMCGIAALVLVVGAVVVKMAVDRKNVRKAEQEAERQRRVQAEREAYNAKKQANKQKNKKG